MQKQFLFFLFLSIFLIILFTGSMPEPINPPTGNTAAPGETACMLSGCHSGGTFTGTVNITGVPDTVAPNQTYSIKLTNKSNAVRSGFQLTVLDGTNKFVGTLIKGTGVNIAKDNSFGRTYARQEIPKFLVNGEASWSFEWKAPATVADANLTFYFTSMCANGDGNNGKDNSIKNTRKVFFDLLLSNDNPARTQSSTWITISDRNLVIHDELKRTANQIKILNLSGDMLYQSDAASDNSIHIPELNCGIYLVQIKLDEQRLLRKIFIQ
jgi:hypothetical protein